MYTPFKTVKALQVTGHTLVGASRGSYPVEVGNCFSVLLETREDKKVVNFYFEDIKYLEEKSLFKWPLDVIVQAGVVFIHDLRIPKGFYREPCVICAPMDLWSPRERLEYDRNVLAGRVQRSDYQRESKIIIPEPTIE